MRILLINPLVRERQPPRNFPLGLGIIAALMAREGHEIRVYDENALRPAPDEMQRDIRGFHGIELIGLGGLITTYAHVKRLVPFLRTAFPKAPIVLGGGVTVDPEVVFQNMPVDFCVHGEGENTFRELCAAIAGRKIDFHEIAGISFLDRKSQEVVVTPPRALEKNLDAFPMPAYHLFPCEIYFKNLAPWLGGGIQRCAALQWSRGCPYQCSFCWRLFGKTFRHRSLARLMEEIGMLRAQYGVDSYLFYDECINASRKVALEFASALIESGHAAPWYSHARVMPFDDEIAAAFRRSGCVGLNFGVESGSRKMLAAMNKHATPEQAAQAVAVAQRANIRQVCTFVIGMPGETRSTVRETVNWILENQVDEPNFFVATPYPKCDLYMNPFVQKRICETYGTKDAFFSDLGDACKPCPNLTGMTDEALMSLVRWAERKSRSGAWWVGPHAYSKRLGRLLLEPRRWGRAMRRHLNFSKKARRPA